MKKNEKNINLLNADFISDKNISSHQFKKTNINILLNKIRLKKKKNLIKKLLTLTIILSVITFIYYLISN